MRTMGIGPVGTLMASGVVEDQEQIILSDFVDRTGDSTLAYAVTEAFRVDLSQSRSVTLVQLSQLKNAFAQGHPDPLDSGGIIHGGLCSIATVRPS